MTDGTSQGLFVVVAVVIFGIFIAISYTLFGDTLTPSLASIFSDSIESTYENLNQYERINEDTISTSDYEFNEKTGTILKYLGTDTEIDIPSQINGVTVRSIASYAFNYVRYDDLKIHRIQNKLTKVVFPNTLETIGYKAFNTNAIKEIHLPNSVHSIGEEAFQMNGTEKLTLSTNLEVILEETFEEHNLKELYIPANVKEIKQRAFIGENHNLVVNISSDTVWSHETGTYRTFPKNAIINYY